MAGPPVVIVQSGGRPFTPVSSGAPEAEVVLSGGFPITLTDNAPPLILNGINPPDPAGPLDYSNIDLGSFNDLTVPFQLESPSVVLGLIGNYDGDPVISITHGGEPLTIIRTEKSTRILSLIAVGTGLTVEMADLKIVTTGGNLGGGAFRINEMTDILPALSGWQDGGTGNSAQTPTYTMSGTAGGLVKIAYVNGYNDPSHRSALIGADLAWSGFFATGTVIPIDAGPTGDWTLGDGWSWDGADLVHTGASSTCRLPWMQGPTDIHPAIQVDTEFDEGAWIRVSPMASVSGNAASGPVDGWVSCPVSSSLGVSEERELMISATGDVRVREVRIVYNAQSLSWIFGTVAAEDGHGVAARINGGPSWAFTAVEILGGPYP